MSHTCKAILIHCMDFRLIKETRNWLERENLIGDCDIVSLAGASKEIADNKNELLLKQIDISNKLHQASQVILLHHSDCGAYKSSYDFKSSEEEKTKQLEDMEKAANIIKKKFPGAEVIKIWAEMKDDNGQEVDFLKIE
ncbi:MAG: carbonic anhydrase [Patescibacteria group bacterium]